MENRRWSIKIKKKNILPIILLSFMMTSKVFLVSINTEYKYYAAIIWIMFHTFEHGFWFLQRKSGFDKQNDSLRHIYLEAYFPYLFAVLYSVLLLFIGKTNAHYLWRGTSYSLHVAVSFIFSFMFLNRYKKDSIRIIICASLLSYFYTLIFAFIGLGVPESIRYILRPGSFTTSVSRWFEMHDLIFSIGFLVIYLILGYNGKFKKNILAIILLIFVFYIGYKRIAIVGLVTSILISTIISNRAKTRSIQVWKIVTILLVVLGLCYVYTYLLSIGTFETIMVKYNINLMGRDRIYTFFRTYYDYSFAFLGNGYGFTSQYLLDNVTELMKQLHGTLGLHNDVLKLYIEIGFWGSLIWHFWYLIKMPITIKNLDFSCLKLFMAFMIYAYIVYLTDNTTTYFWFQFMWSVLFGYSVLLIDPSHNEKEAI